MASKINPTSGAAPAAQPQTGPFPTAAGQPGGRTVQDITGASNIILSTEQFNAILSQMAQLAENNKALQEEGKARDKEISEIKKQRAAEECVLNKSIASTMENLETLNKTISTAKAQLKMDRIVIGGIGAAVGGTIGGLAGAIVGGVETAATVGGGAALYPLCVAGGVAGGSALGGAIGVAVAEVKNTKIRKGLVEHEKQAERLSRDLELFQNLVQQQKEECPLAV